MSASASARVSTRAAVGFAIGHPGISLPDCVELAVQGDAGGLHMVGAGDGFIESFSVLGAIAARTSRIRVISTVATWTRTPVTTAVGAAALDELSGGRFALGLGTMPKEWSEGWHDVSYERPVERMRDFIACIRECWAATPGAPVERDGPCYRVHGYAPLGVRPARPIPIYLGTTRRRMTELAGEIADGVCINHLNSVSWLRERALPALDAGVARAGRSRSAIDVGLAVYCAIAGSEAAAFELIRPTLAFYFPVPYFADLLRQLGYDDELARGRAALAAGDTAGAIGCITDEIVDPIAVAGTAAQASEKLRRYDGLVDWIELMAPLGHPPAVTRGQIEAQIATFGHRA